MPPSPFLITWASGSVAEARATKPSRSSFFSLCKRSTSRTAASKRLWRCRAARRRAATCRSGHLLLFGRLFLHEPHLLARQFQVRLQLLLAAEGVAASVGFDLRPVQRYALQGDQTFGTQHPQHLHEKIVQPRLVTGTKTRERAMTDRLQRAQPLKGRFIFAPPRHLARRTDAAAVGIEPETDQNLGIGVISPRPPLHRADLGIIPAQIQPPHQLPNRARAVIFLNQ